MSLPSFLRPSKVNAAKRSPHQKQTGMCYPAHTRLKYLEFFAPKPLLQPPIPRRQQLEPKRVELNETLGILLIICPCIILEGHVLL